ncbi:Putative flippase GtrA (transmembrane translocase of bactoprenol-linked glucose) [Cryobacterium psychrotolerans]|uniref:Putative flippase GtrA (Transmembrane translocase of bactoprenol-linked glucose) n=2 Tax=Microbacteriaceae TaxID=85023 RepID=A0A1G9BVN0_9MICO|nr:Putative flippase GtrA (transmembrane translocase of bactoprenol-linked glucose) [Cryobacterium psychrotolerans]
MSRSRVKGLAGLGARFLLVGGISTLIEIGVFNVIYLMLGWDVLAAKVVASLVALVNAYFGNREWTFRDRGRHHRTLETALFIVVNAACTGLGAALVIAGVWLAERLLHTAPGPLLVNIVNLGSIVLVVLVRFLLYHFVVFRGVRAAPAAAPSPAALR